MPEVLQRLMREARGGLAGWLWHKPDGQLLGASVAGELLTARIRVFITAGLTFLPMADALSGAPLSEVRPGIFVVLTALTVALGLCWLVRHETWHPWVTFVTAIVDTTLLSGILAYFVATGAPQVALNGRVTFDVYFLVIGMTCLRYDVRLCAVTGVLATLEYLGLVVWATSSYPMTAARFATTSYGAFDWGTQVGRLILLSLAGGLAAIVVQRAERLHQLSTTDGLTSLYNRRYFDDHLRAAIVRAWRYRRPFSMALIDVDHFKQFNDRHGHAAGDQALRMVAALLRDAFRTSDVVARYGGEEFAVLMPETSLPDAQAKVDRVRALVALVSADSSPGQIAAPVTFSAGVAAAPVDGASAALLLERADRRLYWAKEQGRNLVMAEDPPGGRRSGGVRRSSRPSGPTITTMV